jgi:hypothetical protein
VTEFLWTVRKPKTNHASAHVSIDRTQPSRGTTVGKRSRRGVKIECRHRCSRSVQRHSSRDRTSSTHDAPAVEKSRALASRDPQEGRHEAARAVRSATGGAEIIGTETAAARSSRETSLRRVCGKILSESKGGDGARLEGWLREHPARNPRKENTDTLLERPVRRKHRKRS